VETRGLDVPLLRASEIPVDPADYGLVTYDEAEEAEDDWDDEPILPGAGGGAETLSTSVRTGGGGGGSGRGWGAALQAAALRRSPPGFDATCARAATRAAAQLPPPAPHLHACRRAADASDDRFAAGG